jgi:hypothetical protein
MEDRRIEWSARLYDAEGDPYTIESDGDMDTCKVYLTPTGAGILALDDDTLDILIRAFRVIRNEQDSKK